MIAFAFRRPRRCAVSRCATWFVARTPYWCLLLGALLQLGAGYRSANFLVTAADPALAREVALAAEAQRKSLAMAWLGTELPPWTGPCRVDVVVGDRMRSQGHTTFYRRDGQPTDWRMAVQGTRQRVLDSVLPHEITHTILATRFGRPLPRWVEEGVCVTVENDAARAELRWHVERALLAGRGVSLERLIGCDGRVGLMMSYSHGYSVTEFLVEQGGRRKFLDYVEAATRDGDDWNAATRQFYGYESLRDLQDDWTQWVLGDSV